MPVDADLPMVSCSRNMFAVLRWELLMLVMLVIFPDARAVYIPIKKNNQKLYKKK